MSESGLFNRPGGLVSLLTTKLEITVHGCKVSVPEVEFKDPVLLIEPCLRFSGFQRRLFLCILAQAHDYNTIKTGIPGFSQSQIEP
jgi:hypothetical protein